MSEHAVRLRGVAKRFGGVTALADIDLEVERGKALAVVGPNGAGKSTLMRLVAGLAHPSQGDIEFDLGGAPRARTGYVGHATQLYPELTARENLVFAARLQGVADPAGRAASLLAEEGLEAVGERRAGAFSRGMAQRLALARARVHDPALLLLDEPYTGLDRRAADRLTARIGELASDHHTLIVVTHDIQQAGALAHGVAILVGGRLRSRHAGGSLAGSALERAYLDELDASESPAVAS